MEKMRPLYDGPFFVRNQNKAGNYILERPNGEELPHSFPRNQLKMTVAEEEEEYDWHTEPVVKTGVRDTEYGREVRVRWVVEQPDGKQEEWIPDHDIIVEEADGDGEVDA